MAGPHHVDYRRLGPIPLTGRTLSAVYVPLLLAAAGLQHPAAAQSWAQDSQLQCLMDLRASGAPDHAFPAGTPRTRSTAPHRCRPWRKYAYHSAWRPPGTMAPRTPPRHHHNAHGGPAPRLPRPRVLHPSSIPRTPLAPVACTRNSRRVRTYTGTAPNTASAGTAAPTHQSPDDANDPTPAPRTRPRRGGRGQGRRPTAVPLGPTSPAATPAEQPPTERATVLEELDVPTLLATRVLTLQGVPARIRGTYRACPSSPNATP